jgi:prepilin-type N-terminal cleavage/methylation domain-containing protein
MRMKKVGLNSKLGKALRARSGGFTLIEVLVALALFGIIAITFAGGLAAASHAVLIGDIRTNAESVARTEMEYAKSQGYSDAPWAYVVTSTGTECDGTCPWEDLALHQLSVEHAGYTANVQAEPLDDPDDGIQKITVTVSHEDRQVISLDGYIVNR